MIGETSRNALVFGGSGFIGTHLVRRLAAEGQHVVSVDIRPPRERLDGVSYLHGDVRDLSAFDPGMRIDRIYNLAAVHTTPGHPAHEYYETNILGATAIAALARRLGIREIVFTSSISVYGPGEETKREDTPPAPESPYGWSKYMAERIQRDWMEEDESRRLVICRPAVIFGPGEGGNFTRMAKLLKKGFFIYPGRKDTIKACFYVEDLLDALEFAARQPERFVLFNGCYPDRYTLEEIVETFRAQHMRGAKTFLVPRGVVTLAATLLRPFSVMGLGIHPDRVMKLVRSTDVVPVWLETAGRAAEGKLPSAIERWNAQSGGRFV
ncbi:NAD-dependent epimerase/dehydratase family protein [Shinella zoogloeoides]|uniref:NAD-dependent epimerase/dehydratase family protein n=1 Tax=Shinella zoogloeoides TaxID=352475 RepID=A0A6N8TB36_SHIZO|nr:NAD(P)-dependent oxidoreductase [Shinella zoogloeoides]MXO00503.1 NAD-dependent epimerase/dehydratase family protein [Shinella zoogloeoides]UEX83903.1 NAD(P)-dependent oxidoreductase [Shinella zoogloeoides]